VELGGRRLWAALGVGIFFVGVLGFKVLVWTEELSFQATTV
jgi:hypothetical protein